MRRLIINSLVLVLFTLPTMAQTKKSNNGGRPEIGRYCKVYRAGEGLKIHLLRIGPEDRNESLVGFGGFDHPWDGKIFKASITLVDGRQEYRIQYNGNPWRAVVFDTRTGNVTSFVPKYGTEQTERSLQYAEGLSAECRPEWFLTEYLEQGATK